MKPNLENFIDAFRDNTSGCVRTCDCGKIYFDHENSYDWEEGELEALESDTKAIGLDDSIRTLSFEEKEYVIDCNCWRKRAEKIMGFIDGHAHEIAMYLTLEKKRKQSIADNAPFVK